MQGRLITFEGIDGVGKSTHTAQLVTWLKEQGQNVSTYREPGATPLGEKLRKLLKAGQATSAAAELLLFAAARAELVQTLIKPDLAKGRIVVLDRFTDSTLAYQGALAEIPADNLSEICRAAASGLTPDLTLWLDVPPEESLVRRFPLAVANPANGAEAILPPEDAFEKRDLNYFNRVRAIYAQLQAAEPQRMLQLDATGEIEMTQGLIRAAVSAKLKEWGLD